MNPVWGSDQNSFACSPGGLISAEIISRSQRVDGLLIWDMVCGTLGRPCPKIADEAEPRITELGHYRLPPPCIYMMPATIPSPRNNPNPAPQQLQDVTLLQAFSDCFQVHAHEVNSISFTVSHDGADTVRTTTIRRNGIVQRQSGPTAIRRS